MRVTIRSLNLRRDCLLTLVSLLLLHVGTCQAQSSSGFFAIPVSIFVVVATLMCFCFWGCYFYQRAQRARYYPPANAQYTPYVYNQRPNYSGGAQTGSYPVQGYVVPSTTPGNAPQTQQAYPGPGQGYVPSTVTAPYAPPGAPSGATSQTIPQASEPVSLPEATLHHGDAPPGYAEAIGMKTVDITSQDKQ